MVQAMGRYLFANKDEIARVLALESGKPFWVAHIEVAAPRDISNITAIRLIYSHSII